MNIIKRVIIRGFWGDRNLVLDLHPDVNFLIGVNGTGKTTAINLISAALNADFRTLDSIQFREIEIQLVEVNGTRKPSILVTKERDAKRNLPFNKIGYLIKDKASQSGISYSLDLIEEQLSFRELPVRYVREYRDRLLRPIPGVTEHLKKLINVSWLSVHRSDAARGNPDERSYDSTIDRKLNDLSNDFVKFFSVLTKQATSYLENFQKTVFLSLIPKQSDNQLLLSVQKLDLEKENKALSEIFKEFKIPPRDYSDQVSRLFRTLNQALDELHEQPGNRTTISADHFVPLVNAWRIHSVVQEWTNVVDNQKKIYEPRDTFLEVINAMLQRKKLEINEKNELTVTTESGKHLPLVQLSSGEKQLIIVLGEALLQQRTPWIYIADEPELSLHVKWQEQLIASLIRINPQAQIVFATHSPDIVSVYGEKIFDMEDVLQ